MKVYIASSWKNQHAVQMLTYLLRLAGHRVESFVENNFEEGHGPDKGISFEEWVNTRNADRSFAYDTNAAQEAALVIYIGPSGTDAWAEVGIAWACHIPIFGLWAKGEQAGLMRKMIRWFLSYEEMLQTIAMMNTK